MTIGRPPEPVPEEQAEAVVDWLLNGGSLMSWCRKTGTGLRTVYDWTEKDDSFAARFARARRMGAWARFEKAGDIVAEADPTNWQVKKLQAEHEYKAAANFAPGEFGTKQHLEHSGGVSISVVTGVPEPQ